MTPCSPAGRDRAEQAPTCYFGGGNSQYCAGKPARDSLTARGWRITDGGTTCSAPSVTAQPQDQSVLAGDSVSFSAAADGVPAPSMQWQVSTDSGRDLGGSRRADRRDPDFHRRVRENGYRHRAVFSNVVGNATTSAATLTVSKRSVTVTADAKSKYHGQPDPALTYQITSGSLVAGDAFMGGLARNAGEAPGTYPILQGTLALNNNYVLTYVGVNLTILPAADLGITKADSKDPVKPGAGLVYTLVVSNSGPDAAEGVSVVDTLDRDTTYVSTNAPQGWTCAFANGKITCTSSSLTVGSTATIKITVTVSKTVKIGKQLVNNAQVSSATYDLVTTNNTVVQKTLVVK